MPKRVYSDRHDRLFESRHAHSTVRHRREGAIPWSTIERKESVVEIASGPYQLLASLGWLNVSSNIRQHYPVPRPGFLLDLSHKHTHGSTSPARGSPCRVCFSKLLVVPTAWHQGWNLITRPESWRANMVCLLHCVGAPSPHSSGVG